MSVKIYTSPTCPYCHMAKTFMEKNDIEYEEIDVSGDEKVAMEIIKKKRPYRGSDHRSQWLLHSGL